VLSPKEEEARESFAMPEHGKGAHLAPVLRDHPVLDTYIVPVVRIGPTHDVSGGKNSMSACFKEGMHDCAGRARAQLARRVQCAGARSILATTRAAEMLPPLFSFT
jgi:hypothetical protein